MESNEIPDEISNEIPNEIVNQIPMEILGKIEIPTNFNEISIKHQKNLKNDNFIEIP